ncbi:hypothetical protein NDU88_001119 [Pleurodeles waltl]|uniref:Uncharacterized protein n=1 Tax=Pleurodeles waltl TaxID=8319 RepID=A0AAV7P667_PLEWA|nr:hypothetical protein NDU88_001119 [Pleurodeles waltl]
MRTVSSGHHNASEDFHEVWQHLATCESIRASGDSYALGNPPVCFYTRIRGDRHISGNLPVCFYGDRHTLKGTDTVSGSITKWTVALKEYNFVVEYLPGVKNVVADTLTQCVENVGGFEEGSIENEGEDEEVCVIEGNISKDKLRKATVVDEVLQAVFTVLKLGWKKECEGKECEKVWNVREELSEKTWTSIKKTKISSTSTKQQVIL